MIKTLLLAALLLALPAQAAVIYVAEQDGVKVSLTNEPCNLPAVTNLPRRATWEEAGKKSEGCWGAMSGVVAAYFTDRTVAVMPRHVFVKVQTL